MPGTFELLVGASSRDIRLRTEVSVEGQVRTLGREWRIKSKVDMNVARTANLSLPRRQTPARCPDNERS